MLVDDIRYQRRPCHTWRIQFISLNSTFQKLIPDTPPMLQAEVLREELRLASAAFEGREAEASAEFEALTRKCEAAEETAKKASEAARTAAAEREAESKAGSRAQSEAEEAKLAATKAADAARRAEATELELQVRAGITARSSVVLQPYHFSPFLHPFRPAIPSADHPVPA